MHASEQFTNAVAEAPVPHPTSAPTAPHVRINTWQAVSGNDAASFSSAKISSQDWNPNEGFFTSGAFIGDYNALAASDQQVYPVWTAGRDNARGETGIGETDIFTDTND